MDKTTTIVLVVIAVLIVGFMVYSMNKQAQQDRQLQMQLASMQNPTQPQANLWSSLGDLGSLVGVVGGLFGGGGGGDSTSMDSLQRISPNTDGSRYYSTGEAALEGFEAMKYGVEAVNPYANEYDLTFNS